jgi:predicted nuclease with TOPRIM domain
MERENDAPWMLTLIKMLTRTVMENDLDLDKSEERIKELESENADVRAMNASVSDVRMDLSERIVELERENAELKEQVQFLRRNIPQSVAVGTGATGPYVVVEHE